jgi:mono/diheme cytochrome c family protein
VKLWLRRLIMGVAAIVFLIAGAFAGVYGFSSEGMTRRYEIPEVALTIPTDSVSLARGRHLVVAVGKCMDCHDQGLKGKVFIEDPIFGRLVASNLTTGKGGVLANYTDAQLERAIRHGVKADGTPVLFMPSQEFNHFTDEDLAAVVAYVRSLPPVDNELPATKLKMLPRMLYVIKKLDLVPAELIDHTKRPAPITAGVTREYGEYMAETGGCFGCHGRGLSGGAIPGAPPSLPKATNITPTGIGKWTEAQFIQAMRSGVRPDGTRIDPFMPWSAIGQLTDDELRALWLFLSSVEPRTTGTR